MFKYDAQEAVPIVNVTMAELLSWAPTRGRPGADLRSAVGALLAKAPALLQDDLIAIPLIKCFDLARKTGLTLQQIEHVRRVASDQPAVSVGAIMTRDTLIELCLATIGILLATYKFTSRDDVERMKNAVNEAFESIEEDIADKLDSMTWRAIIKVRAAIVMHMYETARPLPRMLNFRFGMPLPTLVQAYKLYQDAGRADELRDENKVVHPGFARPYGRALSA